MRNEDPKDRLKAAREKAGHKSASEAARKIGAKVVTYSAHENGGREFDRLAAIQYGKAFDVDPAWLMFGDRDTSTVGSNLLRSVKNKIRISPPVAENGHGVPASEDVEGFMDMPDKFFESRLMINRDRARVLEVQGDSMYDPNNPSAPGSLLPGERVIVDMDDIRPTPPGPFAIHDGAGVIIKMLEVIPQSDPVKVMMTGRNPRYATYERAVSDVHIVGRVKARVSLI